MSKLTKKFKGQINRETEKAVMIDIVNDNELFSTWIPKSSINMKEMDADYLTVPGMQTFHIKQWFVDSKKNEAKDLARKEADNTKATFLEKVDQINPIVSNFEKVTGHTVIDMPLPPTPDRVEFPYFPGMTIFELRDYHKHEPNGAIRGHIENIIMRMEASTERVRIIELLELFKIRIEWLVEAVRK